MNENENRQLPLLCELRAPEPVLDAVIEAFGENEERAVKAAVAWAWLAKRIPDLTKATAAERCGIKRQHFGAILAGRKYLPPHCINAFEWAMDNTAVSQTMRRFALKREQRVVQEVAQFVAERLGRAA